MIKCPATGSAIPTGMKADRESFRSQPGIFRAHLLFALLRQSRMVCQGGLGLRAAREGADAYAEPMIGSDPLTACRKFVNVLNVPQWFLGRGPGTPWVRVRRCTSSALANKGA